MRPTRLSKIYAAGGGSVGKPSRPQASTAKETALRQAVRAERRNAPRGCGHKAVSELLLSNLSIPAGGAQVGAGAKGSAEAGSARIC
jgi:membrane protein involved in colicin uptake